MQEYVNNKAAGRQRLTKVRRAVIKVGTTSLTYPSGGLNLKRIERLAWVLTDLRNRGIEIILVSSGAIAVGAERLGLPERPRDIRGKQAASSVGQAVLMQIYENFFMQYNQKVAQILLTKDCVENEEMKKNARNTFFTLFEWGVIPIVNENDTISIEELGFSENDTLSAYVACLVESGCLVILSDIEGLYDSDPKNNPAARLISEVYTIDHSIEAIAGNSAGSLGTGGMASKVSAAKITRPAGIDTVIASGEDSGVLFQIFDGEAVGTLFHGEDKRRLE